MVITDKENKWRIFYILIKNSLNYKFNKEMKQIIKTSYLLRDVPATQNVAGGDDPTLQAATAAFQVVRLDSLQYMKR